MSGPSDTQLELQQEQMQFYQEAQKESTLAFGEQQDLLNEMKSVYEPILAKGPGQKGFSNAEEGELTGQAVEGTAGNYTRAARAVGSEIATEGGGNPLASGGEQQAREEVALSSAGEQSREEEQILQADYAAGEHQFEEAGAGLATASGQLSPTSYLTAATGAGSSAESTAATITSEENSWMQPVFGAVGALGGAVLSGGMSNLGKGSGFFGG